MGKPSRRRYSQRYFQRMVELHADAAAHMRALADEDLADDDLCRDLALWVRAYRHDHDGQGPTWSTIVRQVRPELPDLSPAPAYLLARVYTEHFLHGLQERRWLTFKPGRKGSTRPGPRLDEEGALPTEAAPEVGQRSAEPAAAG